MTQSKRILSENSVEPVVVCASLSLRPRRTPLLGRGGDNHGNSSSSTDKDDGSPIRCWSSSMETPKQPESDYKRTVGARCAVYYDNTNEGDFFGKISNRTVPGWFLGTITHISRTTAGGTSKKETGRCTVRFDDNSVIPNLPHDEVLLVRPGTTPATKHLLYRQGRPGEPTELLVADTQPEKVKIGDLVLALFQNGQLTANPDAWYRGRVAHVGSASHDNDDHATAPAVCAIAYDDNDYEENVPLQQGVVTLLERGFEKPAWLEGLTVALPSKRFPHECPAGVIETTAPGQPVSIRYTRTGSKGAASTVLEKRPYNAVVQRLMDAAKRNPEIQFHQFRWKPLVLTDKDRTLPSPPKKMKRTPIVSQEKIPTRQASSRHTPDAVDTAAAATRKGSLRSTNHSKPADLSSCTSNDSGPKKPVARPATKTRSTRQPPGPKPKSKRAVRYEDDRDVTAITETVGKLELDPELPEPTHPLQPMNHALATAYGSALHSADAEHGYEWLSFLLSMSGRIPNDHLWHKLLDLNAWGPRWGRVVYPDSYKMTLCVQYLEQCFAQKGLLDSCSQYIDAEYQQTHGRVSYPDVFFQQMTAVYYQAEGDETRFTAPAMERVVETLRAKASLAGIFKTLLQHNLKPHIVAAAAVNQQQRSRKGDITNMDYQTQPMVRDILQGRRGSKDALEQSVRAWVQLYRMGGHFLMAGGVLQPYLDQGGTRETLNLAGSALQTLTGELGIVMSYMAWLYGKEAHENVNAVASIISNVVRVSLEGDEPSSPALPLLDSSKTATEKFAVRLKLRLIQTLDPNIVPQLRPKLAEHLSVAKIYNVLYDNS